MKLLICMKCAKLKSLFFQGFARYSTDAKWHVPHFEKMLYDQAQLTVAYSNAFQATKEAKFSAIVEDILTYVSRDLSHPMGAFFSAEDADSKVNDITDSTSSQSYDL